MKNKNTISGFSKLNRKDKISWLIDSHQLSEESREILNSHLHDDPSIQHTYEEFSENSISNFFIPFGVAPNFRVNDKVYTMPMAIEESSVVAASAHAAKFWLTNGGFHARIKRNIKSGQVHFTWDADSKSIHTWFLHKKEQLLTQLDDIQQSMKKRGGGIESIELIDRSLDIPGYYQLSLGFITADAMGANFINTVLEKLALEWEKTLTEKDAPEGELRIIMAILSNYTPNCRVAVRVECPIDKLTPVAGNLPPGKFAEKFVLATKIAHADLSRAVTHNKGIMNGIDAVLIATGNDFRAVEAGIHAYASHSGKYRSLSSARIENNLFIFEMEIPLALGTVGGLTGLHPMAKISLELLGSPSADELMMLVASAGLANNFSAVRSLVTSGIQKGHMSMHLGNILKQLKATSEEQKLAKEHFKEKTISYSEVRAFLQSLKQKKR